MCVILTTIVAVAATQLSFVNTQLERTLTSAISTHHLENARVPRVS